MESLFAKVSSKELYILGAEFNTPTSKLFKMIMYLFRDGEYVVPYKNVRDFNKAIRDDPYTKPYIVDPNTKYQKIKFSFIKSFNDRYKQHENSLKAINKKNKLSNIEKYNAEMFDAINNTSDIPVDRINMDVNEPKITPYEGQIILKDKKGCLVVVAAPGVGKTEAVVEYLKTLPPDMKIIVPSFRCALGEKQYVDFESLGFTHYKAKDVKKGRIDMNKHNRIVVQVDSIQRLNTKGRFNGVVILDEIESIIEHLNSSPFIENRSQLIGFLAALIKQAPHVIAMDANLSQGTVKFLEDICGRNVFIYKNRYIRNLRYLNLVSCKAQLEQMISNFLRESKKVYVPTNSRNWGVSFLERITAQFPDLKFKIYDKETKLEKGCDPISDMINYDCCIVTPKFQAGNSFTADHFDVVCGYFSGASCSPQGSSQLMMRVRNLKDPNVYLYVDNSIGGDKKVIHGVKTFEDMIEFMKEWVKGIDEEIELAVSAKEFVKMKIYPNESIDLYDPATFLAIVNKYNMNEGYKDYTFKLMSLLKGMGFSFGKNLTPTDEEIIAKLAVDDKLVTDAVRKTRQDNEAKMCEGLVKAVIPNEKTYQEIKEKMKEGEATKEEKLQVKKKDLLKDVDLTEKHETNPESYKKALEIRRPKRLLNKLIPTIMAVGGLPPDQIELIIKNAIYDVSKYEGDVPGNNKLVKFYMLDNVQKTRIVIILYSILRILGFNFGFFDISSIDITDTKQAATDYMTRYVKDLEKSWKVTEGAKKADVGFIKWLNDKLKAMFDISLVRVDKHKNEYYIKSNWILTPKYFNATNNYVDDNVFEINGRKYVPTGDLQVVYGTIETNSYDGSDNAIETYHGVFPRFVELYIKYYVENEYEKFSGNRFEDSYEIVDGLVGAYVITNPALWSRFIESNRDNEEFNKKASEIYNGNMMFSEYTRLYTSDSIQKELRGGMRWNDFVDMKLNKMKYHETRINGAGVMKLLPQKARQILHDMDDDLDERRYTVEKVKEFEIQSDMAFKQVEKHKARQQ